MHSLGIVTNFPLPLSQVYQSTESVKIGIVCMKDHKVLSQLPSLVYAVETLACELSSPVDSVCWTYYSLVRRFCVCICQGHPQRITLLVQYCRLYQ